MVNHTISVRGAAVLAAAFTVTVGALGAVAQVKTNVPEVVAGAPPALVERIDAHYRTIASRASRGLVGHSMGGYGAARIGMKPADVFGSLYVMSPCCLSPRGSGSGRGAPGGLRIDAGKLHEALDRYGIANTFEVYAGTHTSDVAVRFQDHVMPFFSRTLSSEPAK